MTKKDVCIGNDALSLVEFDALSDLLAYWIDHTARCDKMENQKMAQRQKEWDKIRISALAKAHRVCRRVQGLPVFEAEDEGWQA
jgi:hypothetical protein